MISEQIKSAKKSGLCHILVADDRPERRMDTSLVLSRILKEEDISHEIAIRKDGQEVYDDIIKLGNIYDMLILDYGMPRLDGVSLVKKLRKKGYQGHIIMLTGYLSGVICSELRPIKEETKKKEHIYWIDGIFDIFDAGDREKLMKYIRKMCKEKKEAHKYSK